MPENTMTNQEKLSLLRQEIAKQGLDGFLLPRTDEFQGEFIAPYAECLAWLSGFTGSAGIAVILKNRAVIMSDGRYTAQLRVQVDGAIYDVANSVEVSPAQWIEANCESGGARIGYDPWLHTPKQIEAIKKDLKKAELVVAANNPIEAIWRNRPLKPQASVVLFSEVVAGRSSVQKRKDIDAIMKEKGIDALILTQADSICWLLNVRGGDVLYSPLVHSYAILHQDGVLDWFIDQVKISPSVKEHLCGVTLRRPEELSLVLKSLKGKNVWIDSGSAPIQFFKILESVGVNITQEKDPCSTIKAIKTMSEQAAIRAAHVQDGVAMVRFMAWLSSVSLGGGKGNISEISVAGKLEDFRKQNSDYAGESFATIAGYNENGAVIHYRATKETNKDIKGDGLLLLDSGGQYKSGGTTDITRVFAIGTPSNEMKVNYTRVLKGHIALSRAIFPAGSTGAQVDTIARKPLWDAGMDYPHGTGHGVGCYLGVHEEAANISPRGDKPLQAGMLLSNEPGYYKEGDYGIRIENLILVVEKGFCQETNRKMLGFETVTLAPYDASLIVLEMLDDAEKIWLGAYYGEIKSLIAPLLSEQERKWLEQQITGIFPQV